MIAILSTRLQIYRRGCKLIETIAKKKNRKLSDLNLLLSFIMFKLVFYRAKF